jgi:hypothetical protein
MKSIVGGLTFVFLALTFPAIGTSAEPLPRKYTNVERLSLERLAAVHEDVKKLQSTRVELPIRPEFNDYRCIMHAHAEDSEHTGGKLPEMLADARKANVHVILLTDHFRPPTDFIDGRWRGMKEGVLFIPGSETHGFLIYPVKSILNRMQLKGLDFINTVTDGEGMIFLSHIEERKNHSMEGLTGLEIYNRHWDAKRDKASILALIMKLTDPKQLVDLEKAVSLYPDEVLAFQCDYPDVYLDKWDEGTKLKRLTGVAANDCHHNQVFLVKMVDDETVLVGTNVDKEDQFRRFSAKLLPGIKELTKGRKSGDVLARVDFDPYYRSFRNSCTHILAPKQEESTIRNSLKFGHAYVSHDWICDPSGFRFDASINGKPSGIMGDEVTFTEGLKLTAKLPVAATIRLIRNGKEVAKSEGKSEFEFPVKEAGVYRLEAWQKLDGEMRPWIFANPIYVR